MPHKFSLPYAGTNQIRFKELKTFSLFSAFNTKAPLANSYFIVSTFQFENSIIMLYRLQARALLIRLKTFRHRVFHHKQQP